MILSESFNILKVVTFRFINQIQPRSADTLLTS